MFEFKSENFSKNLKSIRISKGLSIKEFIAKSGDYYCSITKWECGKYKCNLEALCRLAEVLECTPNDLLKTYE